MVVVNLFTGEVKGEPVECAEFYFAYLKKMIPTFEEQAKKAGEEYVKNIMTNQFGKSGKA